MLFKTLGGVKLEGTDFSSPQSLLLLAYVALKGPVSRHSILELFWPSQVDNTKRVKSLSYCVASLKKIDSDLMFSRDKLLASSVGLDVFLFEDAVQTADHQQVVVLYKGLFLEGIEYSKHWQLGEELQEWLDSVRASYQTDFIASALTLLEGYLLEQNFIQIRFLAQRLLALPFGFKSFTQKEYQRFKVVLKAANLTSLLADLDALELHFPFGQLASSQLFGRDDLLSEAVNLVLANRVCVIWGLAGVGKTVFVQTLSRYLRGFFDNVFFLSFAHVSASVREDELVAELSYLLSVSFESKAHLKRYLHAHRFLLCVDNGEQLRHLNGFWLELYSDCPELHLVFASRVNFSFGQARHLELPCLSLEATLAFFEFECHRLGLNVALLSEAEQKRLISVLGGLPLAIVLIAPWFKVLPKDEVLRRIEGGLDLFQSASITNQASFESLISTSVELLPDKLRQDFLSLGVFQDGFDFAAVKSVTPILELDLRLMLDSSLLQFDTKLERYSFHPLLSLYLQAFESSLQSEHAEYFVTLLGQEETRKTLRFNLKNLEVAWTFCLKYNVGFLLEWVPFLRRLADELNSVSLCLKLAKALYEHLKTSDLVLSTLAWLYLRAGKYELSKAFAEQSFAKTQSLENTVLALNALGAAADLQGDFELAESCFKQVLGLASKQEDCSALLNLAVSYLKTGKLQKAEACLIQAERCSGVRLAYLKAWLLFAMHEFSKSLVAFELGLARAYEIPESRWPLQIKSKIIPVLLKLGRLDEAFELTEKSLSEVRQRGQFRSEIAFATCLGDCYLANHAYSEAFQAYLQTLKLCQDSGSQPTILSILIRLLLTHKFELDFASEVYVYCHEFKGLLFYEDSLCLKDFEGSVRKFEGSMELIHLNPIELSQLVLLRYAS